MTARKILQPYIDIWASLSKPSPIYLPPLIPLSMECRTRLAKKLQEPLNHRRNLEWEPRHHPAFQNIIDTRIRGSERIKEAIKSMQKYRFQQHLLKISNTAEDVENTTECDEELQLQESRRSGPLLRVVYKKIMDGRCNPI